MNVFDVCHTFGHFVKFRVRNNELSDSVIENVLIEPEKLSHYQSLENS